MHILRGFFCAVAKRRWTLVVAAACVLADQITKQLVVGTLALGQSVEVVPGVFYLIYVLNSGVAFSFLRGFGIFIALFALAVSAFIFAYAGKVATLRQSVALGLILGGALGNLIDRIIRAPGFLNGFVVDFINLPWLMSAIFNVADICIVCGVCLLILDSVIHLFGQGRLRKGVLD